MSVRQWISFLRETYNKWSEHQAPRLGASVAFYSLLSFAPLLVIVTAVIALIFGHSSAQSALVGEARQLIGARGAETVQSLLKSAQKPASGAFSGLVAFIMLLFGASGVFAELQSALNIIWEAPEQTSAGVWGMVKERLFSFGMVLSVGFLLLVSLLVSTGLAYIGHGFGQLVPLPPALLQAFNLLVSFVIISFLFALMFKYVPNVKVPWRYVIIGALGTALLFTIGKFLLGLYLGKASVGSTYGAAGSLVAVIVWIYYSSQIFFFGAEFTHIYAQAHRAQAPAGGGETSSDLKKEPVAAHPTAPQATAPPPPSPHPAVASQATASAPSQAIPPVESVTRPAPRPPQPVQPSIIEVPVAPAQGQSLPKLAMALGFGFLLGRAFAPPRDEKRP
ncbi:MAG TPA: YihY/virulence factor BrkB family protein [Bryobacteraceae bacterium]|nr:YihY/virulence factor BrkB family protein [Bryobacteraceae bacterium]